MGLLAIALANPAPAAEIRIAVAGNFAGCLQALAPAYEAASGDRLVSSSASTGKLFAQIRAGAPFDVFLAADAERPQRLEAEGLAVPGSRFTYAVGRLVLWGAGLDAAAPEDWLAVLDGTGFAHLALANPRLAPYGRAAREALTAAGRWEALQPRLVLGENVGQTFQFAATGAAELGLVAWSQIRGQQRRGEAVGGRWWLVPAAGHAPIVQQAVLLTAAADTAAARRFLDYLCGPEARILLAEFGYDLPANPGTAAP